MIAEKNFYRTADGKITSDASKGVSIAVRKGCEIPPHMVKECASQKPAPSENKSVAPDVELKLEIKADEAPADVPKPTVKRKPRRK